MNEDCCDLVLKVKYKDSDQEKECCIKCQKILLRMASPFFEDLIRRNTGDTIVIEEPNIKLFNLMISYTVTYQVDLSGLEADDIISLIIMSSKYKLPGLMELCGEGFDKRIQTIPDLTRYFNLAVHLNIQCLKQSCLRITRKHAGGLFCNDSFMKLCPQAVEIIVREDTLNISEMEIFLTVLKWAEGQYSDFYKDSQRNRFLYIAPTNGTANTPFFLQSIENKLLSILKVEPIDYNISGGTQLSALLSTACNNRGVKVIPTVEVRPDDYWMKIRHMLDGFNITKSIRFLALDPLEFSCRISSRNILTNDEFSDILKILNSSDTSLTPPPELSIVRKPRRTYSTAAINAESKLRVYVRLFFEFLQSHISNNEMDGIFSEEFRAVSTKPILLSSVILPPKEKKINCGGTRYVEDIFVEVFKKCGNGTKQQRFASGNYSGRRKYEENISVILHYNVQDDRDAVLHEGSEFVVEISNLSKGTYEGGLTRTSLNNESQFIVTKDTIQKGIIAGFCFFFDMGV